MKDCEINNLFNLNETIANELLKKYKYPWEVLPFIKNYIIELGNSLDKNEYNEISENVWVHKNSIIYKTAYIKGPCIICEGAEIRQGAFIRENAIIGKNAVVGNSTELKNVILFNDVQVPHFNYVGDSILGFKAHMGAGAITSNVKCDKRNVIIKIDNDKIETNMKKVGSFIGDYAEVGCQTVLNPGTIIGKNTIIYPLSSVRGVIKPNSIYKNKNEIILKK